LGGPLGLEAVVVAVLGPVGVVDAPIYKATKPLKMVGICKRKMNKC
jgi:hypothetical protein